MKNPRSAPAFVQHSRIEKCNNSVCYCSQDIYTYRNNICISYKLCVSGIDLVKKTNEFSTSHYVTSQLLHYFPLKLTWHFKLLTYEIFKVCGPEPTRFPPVWRCKPLAPPLVTDTTSEAHVVFFMTVCETGALLMMDWIKCTNYCC